MKRRLLLPACLLPVLLRPAAPAAQPTPPEPLPLRNLLVEVRQDDGLRSTRERLGADVEAGLDARRLDRQDSGRTVQQVLVLNGRPAAIVLGVSVPLRLRQLVVLGGVRRSVPGTVWLPAGTGFTATPVWSGGDTVSLELTATQGRQPLEAGAGARSTVLLPLDAWTTVAESEDAQDQQQDALGLGGCARETRSASRSLRVQVRVSLR